MNGNGLPRTWWVALWSADLPAGHMVGRTIHNIPLVFLRDGEGTPHALLDRCPHRFAPLSYGRVVDETRIECAYHGLQFDAGGRCVFNPHGNQKIPPSANVPVYPVVEKHSAIWIWLSADPADAADIPDFSILDQTSGSAVTAPGYLHLDVPAMFLNDNLLDSSHGAFLHPEILGNADTVKAAVSVNQDGNTVTIDRRTLNGKPVVLMDMIFRRDGEAVDQFTTVRWDPPSCFLIDAGCTEPGADPEGWTGYRGVHFITPETDGSAHYLFSAARRNPIDFGPELNAEILEKLATLRRIAFEEQDFVMLRGQRDRVMKATDLPKPALIVIDEGVVRAHRVLASLTP